MANFVKAKAGISAVSFVLIVIVVLLQTNFFAKASVTPWRKLTWEDFHGMAPPFGRYDASVRTEVWLEYNALAKRYVASAILHNNGSWVRSKDTASISLLNHEQYHFNITEVIARKLNDYIYENPNERELVYRMRLESLSIDLGRMQRQYDNETDHGQIYARQRKWEYDIDSLLRGNKGWLSVENFGASVFFPHQPDTLQGVGKFPYQSFFLNRYGMHLNITRFETGDLDYKISAQSLYVTAKTNSKRLSAFLVDSSEFRIQIVRHDSIKSVYENFIHKTPYTYRVTAEFDGNRPDTIGFYTIAQAFLKSFNLSDSSSHSVVN